MAHIAELLDASVKYLSARSSLDRNENYPEHLKLVRSISDCDKESNKHYKNNDMSGDKIKLEI